MDPLQVFIDALNTISLKGEAQKRRALEAIRNLRYHINDIKIQGDDFKTALDYANSYTGHSLYDYKDLEDEIRKAGGKTYRELAETLTLDRDDFPYGLYSVFQGRFESIFPAKEEFFAWLKANSKTYVSDSLMRSVSRARSQQIENIKKLREFITDYDSARDLFSKLDKTNGPEVIKALGSKHLSSIMSKEEFERLIHDEQIMPGSLIKVITQNTDSSFYVKYIETAGPSAEKANVFQNALDNTLRLEHNFFANAPELSLEYFQSVFQMRSDEIIASLNSVDKELALEHAATLQKAKNLLNQPGIFKNIQHLAELDPDERKELIVEDLEMSSVEEAQKLYSILRELTQGSEEEEIRDFSQRIENLNISLRCKRDAEGSVCGINIVQENSPLSAEVSEEIGISTEALADALILPITIAFDRQAGEFQNISQGLQEYYRKPAKKAHKMARMIYDAVEMSGLDEIKNVLKSNQISLRKLNKKLSSTKVEFNEIAKSLFYEDAQIKHPFTDKALRALLELDKAFEQTWNILLSKLERNNQKIKELIEKFNLILEKLNGKPEFIGSIFHCIDSENITKVIDASNELLLNPNGHHQTHSEIKEIVKTTMECLANNRLEEFVKKKHQADVSTELSFYDAFKQKIKEIFGGSHEDIVLKIIERIHKIKSTVNDLYGLHAKNENLMEDIKNAKKEYESYFECFNVKTYIIKVYDGKKGYNFFSVSLPERHELNLKELPFNASKTHIVTQRLEKLSKDHHKSYINGCDKRNFVIEEYSYDHGAVTLHGDENNRAAEMPIVDFFPVLQTRDIEVADYHCPLVVTH